MGRSPRAKKIRKQKLRERKEQERLAKAQEIKRKTLRKKIISRGALTIGALGLALVAYVSNRGSTEIPPQPQEIVIPSRITFKQASQNRDDVEYVQNYLDQLLKEESKITKEWQGLERLVYDPELKNRTKGMTYSKDIKGAEMEGYATTRGKLGEKAIAYISRNCFDPKRIKLEDELKSLVDNEAHSGYMLFTQRIDMQRPANMSEKEFGNLIFNNLDDKTRLYAFELMSFDYQYRKIMNGDRKVRAVFSKAGSAGYLKLQNDFIEMEKRDDDYGLFAKYVLKTCARIRIQPSK